MNLKDLVWFHNTIPLLEDKRPRAVFKGAMIKEDA